MNLGGWNIERTMTHFPKPASKHASEEGTTLAPKFDSAGLIPCVATEADTGEVLMVAHMNADALKLTIETGEAWYWSRSRQSLWHKGDTSGQIQSVVEMRIDCDQDTVWLRVKVAGDGGCCHTGRKSCFYRVQPTGEGCAELRPLLICS